MPLETGTEAEGKVTGVAKFGAFIELSTREAGLVHISQISNSYVTDINQHIKVGDIVKVKVLGTGKNGKYDLSIKLMRQTAAIPKPFVSRPAVQKERPQPGTLEDKITQFLKQSDERLLGLKKNTEGKQGVRKRKKKKVETLNI
ncbi:MAG: S1 RNA-binding domain-containing protein [Candidatus Saganbacteria bacterium]|nr:S1 RNA-binding domain-containing protein [Candidatus Saganbacteria bacterium]